MRQLFMRVVVMFMLILTVPSGASADGRILATGGVGQVEGSAGGALVPWAVISGYSAPGQYDLSLTASALRTADAELGVLAAAVSVADRFELSIARQHLDLGPVQLRQHVLGGKFKLAGDLIYGALPQFSVGAQYKKALDAGPLDPALQIDDNGLDLYLAASRLWLDGPGHRNWLFNSTLRRTSAIQTGLLGFSPDRSWQLELAGVVLLDPNWAIGAEYRNKPDALGGLREDDWWDVFLAWFPNKRVSLVAGYADLGELGNRSNQRGIYVSLQWNP